MKRESEPEPSDFSALVQQSFLLRITVQGVKGSQIGVGSGVSGCLALLTLIGVVQSPHASPIVMVSAPKIFLAFKSLHESVVLLTVSVFGWFSFPGPFIAGFLLLLFHFLGRCFLGGQFLAGRFVFVLFGGSASSFLLQGVYFSCHSDNLFLFFCGFAPCVFLIQEPCFILIFGVDHKFLGGEGRTSVVTLTLEVFDIDDELVVRCGLVCLPKIIQKVHCLLLPCVESAHLLADPLVELGDIALEHQQFALGFNEHFSYVHGGCRIVHHGQDYDLLEERRRYRDVGD